MDFDIIYKIVLLLAGLGLVVYGIKVINTGMLGLMGQKFQTMLAKNSKSSFKSFLLGTGTTVVLQSSTITNVMANGFLSVGTMGLKQAMAVGIGSALGGALALLLLMFESISVLKIFSIFVLIGAFMFMFAKKSKTKNVSLFLLGFGILCLGVTLMGWSVEGLMAVVDMSSFFLAISNPVLMILLGMIICIFAQSAYPVVAIFIPLVNGGLISFDMACFAVLGINVGAGLAISLVSSAFESGEVGKKFLLFNLIAKLFACISISLLMLIPEWTNFLHNTVCGGEACFSLILFNVFNNAFAIILLPFLGWFSKVFEEKLKGHVSKKMDYTKFEIEEQMIKNPSVALEKTRQNCLQIFELNKFFTKESFDLLFKKLERQNITSNAKLIERAIKISSNNAIRLGGIYGEKYSDKLKVFVDILASQKQILKSNLEICELSKDLFLQKDALTKKQDETLKKLAKDIDDMAELVFDAFKQKKDFDGHKNLQVIFKMHDQNEQNMFKAKKDCLSKKLKNQKDSTLFFALIYQFDNIENEICDIAVKTALLED